MRERRQYEKFETIFKFVLSMYNSSPTKNTDRIKIWTVLAYTIQSYVNSYLQDVRTENENEDENFK